MPPLASGVNSTPRRPRPSIHGGTLAVLLANPRIWTDYEYVVPTDYPHLAAKGDGVNTFANLSLGTTVKKTPLARMVAINATATATAAQILAGYITSTSAAAVALTLPTATLLGTLIGAIRGTEVEFTVDNSVGANTITVTASTGITAATAVVTGSDTLTVASGKIGIFRIKFLTATTANISRIQ